MYLIKCRSVGNPDHGQYAPVSEPQTVTADTIEKVISLAQSYISENGLGGGNWPNCKILLDGKSIGYVSYNGRFWPKEKRA
jgi:hypothetical protein